MPQEAGPQRLFPDRLRQEAVTATGLSDFGEPGFEEGLEVLLRALRQTFPDLTAHGRAWAHAMPLSALENRLHLRENARRHPEIAEISVDEPVFILGLPRSGTTLLHDLLSIHPALRGPLFWELQSPATPAGLTSADLVRRCEEGLVSLYERAPGFRSIHTQFADRPDECTWLLLNEIRSFLFIFNFDVPEYREWLASAPMDDAFFSHRSQLQQILWRRPGGTLLLKDPYHALYLNELTQVYKDARFIILHRDPVEVLGSLCSLMMNVRELSYKKQAVHTYGSYLAELITRLLLAQKEFRQANPLGERILDVRYSRLVADPVATARTVLEFLGLDVSAGTGEQLAKRASQLGQYRYGVHHYSLDRFGPDGAALSHNLREAAAVPDGAGGRRFSP